MAARFSNRVLVLGAGSVSQCVLPLLIEHLVDAKQITIVDMRDNKPRVSDAIAKGATYIQDQFNCVKRPRPSRGAGFLWPLRSNSFS